MSTWPKRPNGTNKSVGEMTVEERRTVFADAAKRVQREFEQPHVKAAIKAFISDETPTPRSQ